MLRRVVLLLEVPRHGGGGGRPRGLHLPSEGGMDYELRDRKVDPNSVAARLEQQASGSDAVLRHVAGVRAELEGEEKVRVKRRVNIPSQELTPVKLLQDKHLKRALSSVTREIEAQERWDDYEKKAADYAATHHGEQVLSKPLSAVLARGSIVARRDMSGVRNGLCRVNGRVVRDPMFLVLPTDEVVYNNYRVLIDYPRIWRFNKTRFEKSFVTTTLNKSVDYERRKIQNLPSFVYTAAHALPPYANGLMLFTNDPGLARYLNESQDIERDWTLRVTGHVPADFIRRLNTGYNYNGKTYNMEAVITEQYYAAKKHQAIRRHDRDVVATCLSVRSWGPTPNINQIFRELGKSVERLTRVKVGPYNNEYLAHSAFEAFIDEQLMQFVDHSWTPWVDMHAPMLKEKFVSKMERHVNMRRMSHMGTKQYADDLEEMRTRALKETAERRRDAHMSPLLTVDADVNQSTEAEYLAKQRKRRVGTMPKTAERSLKKILADSRRKAPINMGMV